MIDSSKIAEIKSLLDKLEHTGSDSEQWGPIIWAILHKTVELIPCPMCRVEAEHLLRGFHDVINVKLNKSPLYPEDLCLLTNYAFQAIAKANIDQCKITTQTILH